MNFFTYIRLKESRCISYNSVYFILAKENWFFFSASRCSLGRTVHSYLQRKRTPESRAAPISMARDHGLQHWIVLCFYTHYGCLHLKQCYDVTYCQSLNSAMVVVVIG